MSDSVFDQAKPMMSLWKKGKIANVDNVSHILEIKTKMTLYSFGEKVKIQFIALDSHRVQITVTSMLNMGPWDSWDSNLQNIKQFEQIMGLEPSIATHVAKHINN